MIKVWNCFGERMVKFVSRYTAHLPDASGFVQYSAEEHQVWQYLFLRQSKILKGRAVPEFIQGLKRLHLNATHIPQIHEVNEHLKPWSVFKVEPVAAVISSESFFNLLSQAKFPVATFIRNWQDIDYITEPDIFHEIFGHVPLLTVPEYASFIQTYAQKALDFPSDTWNFFLRLFWFTIEFGLIETRQGLRIYGGGILSSYGETMSCLISDESMRVFFDPITVLRTPYRIDRIQPIYYVIKSFKLLDEILNLDFKAVLARARALGMWPKLYSDDSPSSHGVRVVNCPDSC
jgi:phenylalanine-4-hydroxylase